MKYTISTFRLEYVKIMKWCCEILSDTKRYPFGHDL